MPAIGQAVSRSGLPLKPSGFSPPPACGETWLPSQPVETTAWRNACGIHQASRHRLHICPREKASVRIGAGRRIQYTTLYDMTSGRWK